MAKKTGQLILGLGFIFCTAIILARFGVNTEVAIPGDFDEKEIEGLGRC